MLINSLRKTESRTLDQIREHYQLEKVLADKLRTSTRNERTHLYTALYDQLFQQIPHHPQLSRKMDLNASLKEVQRKMKLVSRYLTCESIFLEVGAGDCNLSLEVAKKAKKVYPVDVSNEIIRGLEHPENFELTICDGCNIPLPDQTITIAYSNQLMEHLHPDDALDQLRDLYRLLDWGGVYICITPNRLAGPHDVSKHFDETATGFHLKEYTHTELSDLFKRVGFSNLTTYIGGKGLYIRFPADPIQWFESVLNRLPFAWRSKLARTFPARALLGVILVAQK
jgi:SAM-dependent methyltransferase